MRPLAGGIVFFAVLWLEGCGYVGPVLPPSPKLPQGIVDLSVIERNDELIIRFSTPARTTDNLPIERFSEIDLRIGISPKPFDFPQWADAATVYEVPLPPPNDPVNPLPVPITKIVPAKEWMGKHVAVAVRTAVRRNDHESQWSNRVVLDVLPPLAPPALSAESTATGILLRWHPDENVTAVRIFRRLSTDTVPVQIGSSDSHEFLDRNSAFELPYVYTAIATHGSSESLPSSPLPVMAHDTFPPAVPAGVAILAGPNTVELSWQRAPDGDLKGYLVTRSVDGAPFQPVGSLVSLPAFSDNTVAHGHVYRYRVSSVDARNNRSAECPPVEVRF